MRGAPFSLIRHSWSRLGLGGRIGRRLALFHAVRPISMDKGGTSGPHVAGPLAPTLGAWLLGRWHSGRSAPLFHRLAIFGCDRRRSRRRLSDIATPPLPKP